MTFPVLLAEVLKSLRTSRSIFEVRVPQETQTELIVSHMPLTVTLETECHCVVPASVHDHTGLGSTDVSRTFFPLC